MAGINPLSLPGGRQKFFERMPMARYTTGSNPRTDGTMNVTDAVNAGHTVMPWVPSSGAGPGTYGYRGSGGAGVYSRSRYGYGGGGGGEETKTKRPTASNSDEFYANRDATIGNPLAMLKRFGPNRNAIGNSILNEVRSGGIGSGGMTTRTNADGSVSGVPDWSGEPLAPSPSSAMGRTEYSDGNHNTIADANGSRLFSRWGNGSVTKRTPSLPVSPYGEGADFEAVEEVPNMHGSLKGEGAGFEALPEPGQFVQPQGFTSPLAYAMQVRKNRASAISPFPIKRPHQMFKTEELEDSPIVSSVKSMNPSSDIQRVRSFGNAVMDDVGTILNRVLGQRPRARASY